MIEKKYKQCKRAVLIGLITTEQGKNKSKEYLDELNLLAQTANIEVCATFFQRVCRSYPKTFIGDGKLQDIVVYVKKQTIDTIIFDDELSPTQLKNIRKYIECTIIDRTQLILDIFYNRAKTYYARTQVEMAQYQYILSRLTRMWTHLERQRGGIGFRGPGETELETDRRILRDRIGYLRRRLLSIDTQMFIQRKHRNKFIRVAIIGYTNVGKSTLMNILSKSTVFIENKLFATVDPTVRKTVIGNIPLLIADTVGFIRKLPTLLIKSFKSTLDEVRESDILLHVIDISHESFEEHIHIVRDTLYEIGIIDKPVIMVFNKIDTVNNLTFQEWKHNSCLKYSNKTVFLSAQMGIGISELKKMLFNNLKILHNLR
ncbi:GTPase HflX [Candidatus Walczuchella endosymbiont of Icerya purchasi]|uniref:GTPase HflX n=1 Tax=Candidatus Walczuchella endosymbiont of Icerya purchasi TaxID=3066219 RepID=UPI00313DB7E7